MPDRRRSNLPSLFFAPIASATVGGLIYAAAILALGMPLDFALHLSPLVALAHLALALVATWWIGLPWHLWRQSIGKVSLGQYWSAAAMVGFVFGAAAHIAITNVGTRVVFLTPGDFPADLSLPKPPTTVEFLLGCAITGLYGAFIGGLTGAIFWLIRRPDRDPRQE